MPWPPLFVAALSALNYVRLYLLQDVYADDNCWLLGIYLGYNLPQFLGSGFTEMRREPLGVFLYFFFLPYRLLDNPHFFWHSVVLGTQIATALLFYKLVDRICEDRWLAGCAAGALIVLPLDHALPYLSGFNYRAALLLGLASLYLTDCAVRQGRWGWQLPSAILLAVVGQHALSEATLALEPARLVLIWNRLWLDRRTSPTAPELLRYWLAFLVLSLPLIGYKLLVKPFGMYDGMYGPGFSHFFDLRDLGAAIRLFAFGEWAVLRRLISYAHAATPVLAVAATVLGVVALMRLRHAGMRNHSASSRSVIALVVFAAAILLAQLFLFFFAGRPPRLGFDSTHAILAQPGYAILLGTAAWLAARRAASRGPKSFASTALAIALICGTGTYFNNLKLDLFAAASEQQKAFWQQFQARFPKLPERADFLIDARPKPYHRKMESYYEWEDLQASYKLEFVLNRLYGREAGPTGTRRYRVYTPDEAIPDLKRHGSALLGQGIRRLSHFGVDTLDAASMTVVYYREGRLLVNQEIVQHYPGTIYRPLADKPLPAFSRP